MSSQPRRPFEASSEPVVRSRALRRTFEDAARAAPTGCHVLILGERGVGKDVLARFLHERSGRRGELVALNCATIQPSLAESILFGHARGAFTGATAASAGQVRAAEGGTLFLDEVGELPLDVQARLLRLLQERVVEPLGERERAVDVRIVAATNRDLDEAVARGLFRADLRDRLHLVSLRVPPLRERREEIGPLADRFLATAPELSGLRRPGLSKGALAVLREHAWPGNLRELRNVVLSAAILSATERLGAAQIRRALGASPEAGVSTSTPERGDQVPERLLELLQGGQRLASSEIARRLGVSPSTAKRVVRGLSDAGRVELTGRGRGTRVQAVLERRAPEPLASIAALGRAPELGGPAPEQARRRTFSVEPGLRDPASEERAARQERVALELLRREGHLSSRSLAAELGQELRTAERVLRRLMLAGRLQAEGFGRARVYGPARSRLLGATIGDLSTVTPRPPDDPELLIAGERLPLGPLRVALALAAGPSGASPGALAREERLSRQEARRLLDALAALDLLERDPGQRGPWRLKALERGGPRRA